MTDLPVTKDPWEERFSFRERQIAVSICLGLSHQEIAEALGITRQDAGLRCWMLIEKCGMNTPLEFAMRMNAAWREKA